MTRSRDKSTFRANAVIQLVDEVTRMQGRLKHLFNEAREESGMGSTDSLVLASVLEADSPPTVPQIGRSLGHPRQVIQRAVNKLEQDGYIDKLPNPAHKRAPLLRATARGVEFKRRADRLALTTADAFLAEAGQRRVASLAQDLHDVRHALEQFLRERGEP